MDGDRVASLDLIRGVAVLGILAVNIAGLSGPSLGVYSPDLPRPGSTLDHTLFAATLVVFEGKMRALFSILFGAGLLLFVERKETAGQDGQTWQLRRLGWLAVFGYLHFLLLWWGDILFLYALAGLAVIALRQLPSPALLAAALIAFAAWQGQGVVAALPALRAEAALAQGTADTRQRWLLAERSAWRTAKAAQETREYRAGFAAQVATRLTDRPFYPLSSALFSIGETIPYMLLGMVLLRSGFFSGGWSRRRLWATAAGGIGIGGAATLAFTRWAWERDFPVEAMALAINHGLSFPHLLMALGYAALLILAAPRLSASWPGRSLTAAGRMAFSNYIGTSLVLGIAFQGWGFDRFGQLDRAGQTACVMAVWAIMLGWSAPWLARFGIGPLESVWRRLSRPRLTRVAN